MRDTYMRSLSEILQTLNLACNSCLFLGTELTWFSLSPSVSAPQHVSPMHPRVFVPCSPLCLSPLVRLFPNYWIYFSTTHRAFLLRCSSLCLHVSLSFFMSINNISNMSFLLVRGKIMKKCTLNLSKKIKNVLSVTIDTTGKISYYHYR